MSTLSKNPTQKLAKLSKVSKFGTSETGAGQAHALYRHLAAISDIFSGLPIENWGFGKL